jgi:hypothetical protein
MGRTAVLLVIGLGIAFGFISNSIRSSVDILTETAVSYTNYSYARNLARTAIHATLRAYDRGLDPIPTTGSFNGGTWNVNLTTSADTLWIVSTGTYADSSYTMRVKLARSTKPFPAVNAAIGIRATPIDMNFSGHPNVDGRNWNADGTALVGSGDLPGVTTMNTAESAAVAHEGGSDITGSPAVKVDTSTIDPNPFLGEYMANADYIYNTTGTYSGQTWGSATHPAIVYCNAGADTSFSIKFSGNVTGYGILVVQGNINFAGNFTFYGLVVVAGFNTQVEFSAMGTPQIIGGLVVAGNSGASVSLKGSGSNSKLKYSSAALDQARNISKLLYYKILSWYE